MAIDISGIVEALNACAISDCGTCAFVNVCKGYDDLMCTAANRIEELEERISIISECKHGHWVYYKSRDGEWDVPYTTCSCCHKNDWIGVKPEWKYCPDCGALMDEEEEQDD